jgi:hypothetical protein
MAPNPWIEKAERLRFLLARLHDAVPTADQPPDCRREALERTVIAHWLRQEFRGDGADHPGTGANLTGTS